MRVTFLLVVFIFLTSCRSGPAYNEYRSPDRKLNVLGLERIAAEILTITRAIFINSIGF